MRSFLFSSHFREKKTEAEESKYVQGHAAEQRCNPESLTAASVL